MEATSLRFAAAARALGRGARAAELAVPGFRSPPRLSDVDRSLRRRGDNATVAIRLRGRPWMAVVSDMVEGVIAANRLEGPAADQARSRLWSTLDTDGLLPPPPQAPPGRPTMVPSPRETSRPDPRPRPEPKPHAGPCRGACPNPTATEPGRRPHRRQGEAAPGAVDRVGRAAPGVPRTRRCGGQPRTRSPGSTTKNQRWSLLPQAPSTRFTVAPPRITS